MKRIYLSHGHLEALAECETLHVLKRRGYQPHDEAAPLACGKAIHTALEAFRKGDGSVTCLGIFEHAYREYSEANVPTDDARDWRNVMAILAEYIRRRSPDQVPWQRIVHVEKGYGAKLCTIGDVEIWYYTRPDAIVERDGQLATLDTKSTGWLTKDWERQWHVAPQITGQMWTLEKVLGKPVQLAFIDGIELKRANSSTAKCRLHAVAYCECAPLHMNFQHVLVQREPHTLTSWLSEAAGLCGAFVSVWEHVAKHGIRAVNQRGIYNGTCTKYSKWCTFYDFCAANRPVEFLDSMFTVSDWQLDEVVDTPDGPMRFRGGEVLGVDTAAATPTVDGQLPCSA